MSLPTFSTQSELFSTAGLSASLFPERDRYRLFAKRVYSPLVRARPALEKCYCPENGRTALEPVLMLGVSLLQDLDGVPDGQAVEMLRYQAGWNFALNRQLGDPVFHPSSLVNFRNRLEEHQQSTLGFTIILEALAQAGLVSRQSRQRLDSTQIFGRVAKMSRLDCLGIHPHHRPYPYLVAGNLKLKRTITCLNPSRPMRVHRYQDPRLSTSRPSSS